MSSSLENQTSEISFWDANARMPRLNYIIALIIVLMFYVFLEVIVKINVREEIIKYILNGQSIKTDGMYFYLILKIIIGYFYFLIIVRRLHDINYSGGYSVLFIVPLFSLFLIFPSGTKGNNKYGFDPREEFKHLNNYQENDFKKDGSGANFSGFVVFVCLQWGQIHSDILALTKLSSLN